MTPRPDRHIARDVSHQTPQRALTELLRQTQADGESPAKRLREPDAALVLVAFATQQTTKAGIPRHVDRHDPVFEVIVRLYETIDRLDPTVPPAVQMSFLIVAAKGALIDYKRRNSPRLRAKPGSDPESGQVKADIIRRANVAAMLPSVDTTAVDDKIEARWIDAMVGRAASTNPACAVCRAAAAALGTGEFPLRLLRAVRYHDHLLCALSA